MPALYSNIVVALSLIGAASAAATPATVNIAKQLGPAFDRNGDAAGVAYWKAGSIVDGHNDLSLSVSGSASIAAMYNTCLGACKAHKCHSFDMVVYKHTCFFDVRSTGDVLFHPDPKRPNQPYEKEDPLGVAYIKMKPYPAVVAPKPQTAVVAPKPQVPVPVKTNAPAPCYGFGLKLATAEVVLADSFPTDAAARADLTKQCGGDDVCLKYVECDVRSPCGSIAIPPDTKLRGKSVKPGVTFGKTRGEVKAKALAVCQAVLDDEGMDGECKEMADFCFPKH